MKFYFDPVNGNRYVGTRKDKREERQYADPIPNALVLEVDPETNPGIKRTIEGGNSTYDGTTLTVDGSAVAIVAASDDFAVTRDTRAALNEVITDTQATIQAVANPVDERQVKRLGRQVIKLARILKKLERDD